jgi:hypothetical protein
MKKIIYILTFIVFAGCNSTDKNKIGVDSNSTIGDSSIVNVMNPIVKSSSDLPDRLIIDKKGATTLERKRKNIMTRFLRERPPVLAVHDTLIDLNYDGLKDYIIAYYEPAGTGVSNKVNVYFFDIRKNNYILDEQLSDFSNPTFYTDQKKITGFYIGVGSGEGYKLEWINDEWILTKEFEVENEGDSSKWIISFPPNDKTEMIVRPYEMIPPSDILESRF